MRQPLLPLSNNSRGYSFGAVVLSLLLISAALVLVFNDAGFGFLGKADDSGVKVGSFGVQDMNAAEGAIGTPGTDQAGAHHPAPGSAEQHKDEHHGEQHGGHAPGPHNSGHTHGGHNSGHQTHLPECGCANIDHLKKPKGKDAGYCEKEKTCLLKKTGAGCQEGYVECAKAAKEPAGHHIHVPVKRKHNGKPQHQVQGGKHKVSKHTRGKYTKAKYAKGNHREGVDRR